MNQHTVPEITPTELKQRLDADDVPVLVDVREPHEVEIADLPDHAQVLIPTGEFVDRMSELDSSEIDRHSCTDIPILRGGAGHRSPQTPSMDVLGALFRRVTRQPEVPGIHLSSTATRADRHRGLRFRRSVVLII